MSETPTDTTDEVQVRRAPKFSAFIIVGGGIGAILTYVLTSLFPVDPNVGFGALFAYFALFGVSAGVLIGAVLAVILDRRSRRNAKTVTVEREVVPRLEDEFEQTAGDEMGETN